MNLKKILILLIFVIPTLLISIRLTDYAYLQTSIYSDLTISHLPYAEFIRDCLFTYGRLPLWYSGLFGGIPLIAHPLSGIWYPFGWMTILLPTPEGFNLAFAFHMFIAGYGMYKFLGKQKISEFSAIVGGLAFELTPKLMAHWAAGHVSLCFAFSLTPWLLFFEEEFAARPTWKQLIPSVAIFSLIIMADIRWAAYSGLVWIAFRFYKFLQRKNHKKELSEWLVKSIAMTGLSFLITAPFLYNFIEFSLLSTRALMTTSDTTQFGLPPEQLIGIFFPDFGGFAEWIFYPGALGLILSTMILFSKKIRKQAIFWLILGFLSIFFAMAANLTGRIPGLNILRVSSRFLFIFNLSTSILLGLGINYFINERLDESIFPALSWLAGAGVSFLVILLNTLIIIITGEKPVELVWGMAAYGISMGFLFFYRYVQLPKLILWGVMIFIITIDLGGAGYGQIRWVKKDYVNNADMRVANLIKDLRLEGRGYSPGYQITQMSAERTHQDMISGIDPMQLANFASWLYSAANIPPVGYSVAIPPLNSNPIQNSNYGIAPDAQTMAWMNVGWVAANFSLSESDGWKWRGSVDGVEVYQNIYLRPRAWLQGSFDKVDEIYSPIDSLRYFLNRFEIEVKGPGSLVLSENYYPGWSVLIDGVQTKINIVEGLMMSVEVPAGEHNVQFIFFPQLLKTGFMAQLIGIIVIVFIILRKENA